MCGILFHVGKEIIGPEHPALKIIAHRGPDGHGAASFPLGDGLNVGLGHRRLAILDLSENGRQPMTSPDGGLCVTFNGEIFNYLELRRELQTLGHKFHSDCDTEVLLAAYAQWGAACLSRLNGMFAFCVYDQRRRLAFLARDRFGVKPLSYHNVPGGFTAVSEIKQLTQMPGFKGAVNKDKLFHYLDSGDFCYDNENLWDGVYELPGGHYLELPLDSWRPGQNVAPKPWYTLSYEPSYGGSFKQACEQYLYLLKDSIELRLRSDVPVGFLLSGGLDSTSLVGLCAQLHPDRKELLKTFSSCYDEKAFDEREFIMPMLQHAAISSSLHFPKPEETFDALDAVVWSNDTPVQPRSTISQWLLYQHIKQDNDSRIVILEGQGADEVFAGYADFFWPFMYEQLKGLRLFPLLREMVKVRSHYGYSWKVFYRKFLRTVFPSTVIQPPNPAIRVGDLLAPGADSSIPVRREHSTVAETHRARMTILNYILRNVDRNSMAHSRETRVPFLDYRLVEFGLSLPSHFKLGGGYNKLVNREAVGGVVPEKVRWRKDKQGYSSPISVWAAGPMRQRFEAALDEAAKLPFVDGPMVLRGFADHQRGKAPFDPFWWRLIAADKWLRMFKISG